MESDALRFMSTDELWSLHEQVNSMLARKIAEQKGKLEERLRRLENKSNSAIGPNRPRRAYPISEIFESKKSHREMDWSWKATTLGAGAA